MSEHWSKAISNSTAARRAGGRRRHNAERKREMWGRRFAILRMLCSTGGDLPHGGQRLLAERFGAHKSVISRDVAWARENGFFENGFTPRCSHSRGTVTVTWVNTGVNNILRAAQKWLKEAERAGAAR